MGHLPAHVLGPEVGGRRDPQALDVVEGALQRGVHAMIVVTRRNPMRHLLHRRMSVVHGNRDTGGLEHLDVVGGIADGHHLVERNGIIFGDFFQRDRLVGALVHDLKQFRIGDGS